MLKRITTGWTFMRVLYLIMGIIVIGQALQQQQWLGVLFGGYFASMGLFSFGCAAGNCFVTPSKQNTTKKITEEISYEEVK
jgi:hypothetical protein